MLGAVAGVVTTPITTTSYDAGMLVGVKAIIAAIALTLRKRKDTRAQKPGEQVLAKKADRLRIVKMDPVVDAPAPPPAAPGAACHQMQPGLPP